MHKFIPALLFVTVMLLACEEVVEIDLNSSKPAFVVEASISNGLVAEVRLTGTTSYFSPAEPAYFEDAIITISDGITSEVLNYAGSGYYRGQVLTGNEDSHYDISVLNSGLTYLGSSYMPPKTDILSLSYFKDDSQGILNPDGKTIYTIRCTFGDDPLRDNFYLIKFIAQGRMLERYYLLTDSKSNTGSMIRENDMIIFSESLIFAGGEVDVELYSIDESVYNIFIQLDDILFWKRRLLPPTPYNPVSNLSNGALGYFAAWAIDSKTIILE
jgi:hypothetical protein